MTRYGRRRFGGASWRSIQTSSVTIDPSIVSVRGGEKRRSISPDGKCHSKSTTCSPPINRASKGFRRGPMPGRLSISAKSGNNISGRMTVFVVFSDKNVNRTNRFRCWVYNKIIVRQPTSHEPMQIGWMTAWTNWRIYRTNHATKDKLCLWFYADAQ